MVTEYWELLEQRRVELGIEFPALASRSGLSVPSLKRLLSGRANPTVKSLGAVASVLGVEVRIADSIEVVPTLSPGEVRQQAATEKAERLVRLVQGTSALESQAVEPSVVRDMVAQTVHELLAGPKRRLWAR
jgi:transcriptional regulator with XRE-family HTH domain